jgi:peptidylprolyl isomerase
MKNFRLLLISLLIAIIFLFALYPFSKTVQKERGSQVLNKEETKNLSENIGHLLADTLKEHAPYYDLQIVMDTIKRIENKEEPLKSPETFQTALFDIDQKLLIAETEQNLRSAEKFLADLSHSDKIIELEKGKLYYEVITEGKGSYITKESAPLFHFTETNLDNKTIRDTREDNKPIKIKLSETIIGFSRGVSGMGIGERRKIYVHPVLAYGKLSRQQLSIFDVEIISD